MSPALIEHAAVFGIAAALGGASLLVTRIRHSRAKSWPVGWATIEYAQPRMVGGGQTAHWVGELAYSYCVNGEYYSGCHHFPVLNEEQGWHFVEGWKGKKVIVRYSAQSPENSVLIPDEQDQEIPT